MMKKILSIAFIIYIHIDLKQGSPQFGYNNPGTFEHGSAQLEHGSPQFGYNGHYPGTDSKECKKEVGVKYRGSNIAHKVVDGIETCAKWCKDTTECQVWSFRTYNKKCWIKANLRRKVDNNAFISGNKLYYDCSSTTSPVSPTQPPSTGFNWRRYINLGGSRTPSYSINSENLAPNMVSDLVAAMRNVFEKPDWEIITSTHGGPVRPECNLEFCCVHNDLGGFLPWHRILLAIMNNALKHIFVRLPYWDWTTTEFPSIAKNPTIADPSTGQEMDNPFYSAIIPANGSRTYRQISEVEPLGQNLELLLDALREDNFQAFSSKFNALHASVHIRLGGNMGDIGTSGYDPVFYLHHSFVDLIFAVYQKLKPWSLPPQFIMESEMLPYGIKAKEVWNYPQAFGYYYNTDNLDLSSPTIVFGGMTLAQIRQQVFNVGRNNRRSGSVTKPEKEIYAGFILQSFQTSGKIKFNCCNLDDCSYHCGEIPIFGGDKEKPSINQITTDVKVTDIVTKENISVENLRFNVTAFEDVHGKEILKNVFQPITKVRSLAPQEKGKDLYMIHFDKEYNLPPKLKLVDQNRLQIHSQHLDILETVDEHFFEDCKKEDAKLVPAGKPFEPSPGDHYYFDKYCANDGTDGKNGLKIHIIKE